MNSTEQPTPNSFTDSITQLEVVVDQLRKGTLPLEDALRLFESGVKHLGDCQAHLNQAKGKVEVLLEALHQSGQLVTQPFQEGVE